MEMSAVELDLALCPPAFVSRFLPCLDEALDTSPELQSDNSFLAIGMCAPVLSQCSSSALYEALTGTKLLGNAQSHSSSGTADAGAPEAPDYTSCTRRAGVDSMCVALAQGTTAHHAAHNWGSGSDQGSTEEEAGIFSDEGDADYIAGSNTTDGHHDAADSSHSNMIMISAGVSESSAAAAAMLDVDSGANDLFSHELWAAMGLALQREDSIGHARSVFSAALDDINVPCLRMSQSALDDDEQPGGAAAAAGQWGGLQEAHAADSSRHMPGCQPQHFTSSSAEIHTFAIPSSSRASSQHRISAADTAGLQHEMHKIGLQMQQLTAQLRASSRSSPVCLMVGPSATATPALTLGLAAPSQAAAAAPAPSPPSPPAPDTSIAAETAAAVKRRRLSCSPVCDDHHHDVDAQLRVDDLPQAAVRWTRSRSGAAASAAAAEAQAIGSSGGAGGAMNGSAMDGKARDGSCDVSDVDEDDEDDEAPGELGINPKLWLRVNLGERCEAQDCTMRAAGTRLATRRHYHATCGHVHASGAKAGMRFHHHQLEKIRKHQRAHKRSSVIALTAPAPDSPYPGGLPVEVAEALLRGGAELYDPALWSADAGARLGALVEQQHARRGVGRVAWDKVAAAMRAPALSASQCMLHWRDVVNGGAIIMGVGTWCNAEDTRLRALTAHFRQSWATIARFMPGRGPKQCRERFNNVIDPASHKRAPWKPAEDELLMAVCAQTGGRFTDAAPDLPGHGYLDIKARYELLYNGGSGDGSCAAGSSGSSSGHDDSGQSQAAPARSAAAKRKGRKRARGPGAVPDY